MKRMLLITVLLLVGAGTVNAQNQRRRPRRIIKLDVLRIEGRIQKPQAFYILQRSNLNFEGLELKRSFVPKIIESVESEPF